MNLVDWRKRASRERLRWLGLWSLWLALSVTTLTGSAVMALQALSHSVPDRVDEWRALSATYHALSETVKQLQAQLSEHQKAAEEQVYQADVLAARRTRLLDAIEGVPLRLLTLHDHPNVTRIRVQVAGLSVLKTSPRWSTMHPESIHTAAVGATIALRIDD